MSSPSLILPRRRLLGAGLVAGATLAAPYVARGQGALKPIKVSVGRIPWSAFNSPMSQLMINNKLFEKHAAALGYDVTVDWREYPTALPMVEAIVGNNLDMGMWGNTPIIRSIIAGLPISLMVVGEGHLRLVITTRKGSDIRTVQDLKGKTVGALLGGDPYNALAQILRYELGSPNPRDHGIKIINTPTLAQAAELPSGMDAGIAVYPAYLAAEPTGTAAVANSFGYTEDYYKGKLGEGGGIMLPSVKTSPFYPDGFYLHRSFWLLNNRLGEKEPNIVIAWLMAQQEAVETLAKMDAGAVSQLVSKYWKLDAVPGAKVVKDDVVYARGWSWPTENDARAVLEVSKFLVDAKVIPKPLDWKQVTNAFALTTPLVKQAYERMGAKVSEAEFTRTDTQDLRGLPVWQSDRWSAHS